MNNRSGCWWSKKKFRLDSLRCREALGYICTSLGQTTMRRFSCRAVERENKVPRRFILLIIKIT
jgi:hypothetical protein